MPKILDCTLRDGGYINNWDFPLASSKDIISLLKKANIDFIEIGFYHHNLDRIIPENSSNIYAMVQYSKTPLEIIPSSDKSKIKNLRIIFKKHEKYGALDYCAKIKDLGYKIFINATFINQYKDGELAELIGKVNNISPFAFTVTDSMGTYTSSDIKRIYNIIKNELKTDISLCFHSHNNLGLSLANAKTLIEINSTHELIIDSCLLGMGRGAGNLNTELIAQYLNLKNEKYNIKPVFQAIEKYINPIYKKHPWGYSVPYYLSALHGCHPNYARDLIQKKIKLENMDKIFSAIPEDKKAIYDSALLNFDIGK